MQTFLCYVHMRGAFLPTIHRIEAASEEEASDLFVAGLRALPDLHSIEVIEIFDEDHAALQRMRVDSKAPTH